MTRRITTMICTGSAALLLLVLPGATANAQTQMQIYGAWHCYSDACSWASVPNMTTFDTDNRWLIDRNMNGVSALCECCSAELCGSRKADEPYHRFG